MTRFKNILQDDLHRRNIAFPSVSVSGFGNTLALRFTSKDELVEACYSGSKNPLLAALCEVAPGKKLHELKCLNLEKEWKDDQGFWEFLQEHEQNFISTPLELLYAALDLYRGRDYLYKEASPLVCRCFGVREEEIISYLQKADAPSLDALSAETKAGMGCRSCVNQLKRWLVIKDGKERYYKNKPLADWLIDIDHALERFPKSRDWKMEIESFKGNQVLISYEIEVQQRQEEETGRELQDFLSTSVDGDLGFFLRRARHFSKARG